MKRRGKVINSRLYRGGLGALSWASRGCHWGDGSLRQALIARATAVLQDRDPTAIEAVGRRAKALRASRNEGEWITQTTATEAVLGTAEFVAVATA